MLNRTTRASRLLRPLASGRLVLALGCAAALGVAASACDVPEITGEPCNSNADCSDGVFCNGEEICVGNVCAQLDPPQCNDGVECTIDQCDEQRRQCVSAPPDADGDGAGDGTCFALDGVPLGTDCDDQDPNRFPENVERCDEEHLDEDCDPNTFGAIDADNDGHQSAECCNDGPDGLICGTDCDDEDPWVRPGVQICDSKTDDDNDVLVCGVDGQWINFDCFGEAFCEHQPNNAGVCVPY